MAPSPSEKLLRLTLRTGTVYYFQDRSLTSQEPHYFIVLNKAPLNDDFLILTLSTSKVQKVKTLRKNLPGTYVEIQRTEYIDFTKDSIVDCNVVVRRTRNEILEKITTGHLKYKSDMPIGIVAKLKNAIFASPLIDDEVKKLL